VFRCDKNTWGLIDTGANDDLLNFVSKNILDQLAEGFEFSLELFLLLLLILSVVEVKTFLGAGNEFLAVVLLKLLNHIFINGVNEVKNFVATLLEAFKEGGSSD
jgi:hypothetical protein